MGKKKPTKSQQRVLDSDENLLVIGRPGTGKTSVALWKAAKLIRGGQMLDFQRVLFVSFSNAAVQRIRAAAGDNLTRETRRLLHVTTFHAFCYRLLASHHKLVGLPAFKLFPPEELGLVEASHPDDSEGEIGRLEQEEGHVTFDRFAPLCLNLIERHEHLAAAYSSAYPLILVDEYQDTDDNEDTLIGNLAAQSQLICLGDPEQRIYDYRPGSRHDRLEQLEATGRFKVVKLEGTNHRSGERDLVAVARAVLDDAPRIKKPSDVALWGIRKNADLADSLKKALVSTEKRLMKRLGQGASPTIAIMATRNRRVGELSGLLKTPSDAFPRPFGHQVLLSYESIVFAWRIALRLLEAEPEPQRACVADAFQLLANIHRLRKGGEAAKQAARLAEWSQAVAQNSVTGQMRAVKQLLAKVNDATRARTGDPIRDLRAIREILRGLPGKHFARVVRTLDLRLPAGEREPATERLAETYHANGCYAGAVELGDDVLLRERLTDSAGAGARRVLLTLHKCKGKEFDAVFIVDGFGPHNRLVLPGDPRDNGLPRSRRLLSVAITRARYGVLVFTPAWDRCELLPDFT